jgi:hypothetical protein
MIENAELRIGPEVSAPVRCDFCRQNDHLVSINGASDNGTVSGNRGYYFAERNSSMSSVVTRSEQSAFGQSQIRTTGLDQPPGLQGSQFASIEGFLVDHFCRADASRFRVQIPADRVYVCESYLDRKHAGLLGGQEFLTDVR